MQWKIVFWCCIVQQILCFSILLVLKYHLTLKSKDGMKDGINISQFKNMYYTGAQIKLQVLLLLLLLLLLFFSRRKTTFCLFLTWECSFCLSFTLYTLANWHRLHGFQSAPTHAFLLFPTDIDVPKLSTAALPSFSAPSAHLPLFVHGVPHYVYSRAKGWLCSTRTYRIITKYKSN